MALNSLKKIIKYRSTYSGTKETDILYEKYFIKNLNNFDQNQLNLLKSLFDVYSDDEIYDILTKKIAMYLLIHPLKILTNFNLLIKSFFRGSKISINQDYLHLLHLHYMFSQQLF